jgi:phosphatidylserine decarboxylase
MILLEPVLKPMHRAGLPFVAASGLATLALFWVHAVAGLAGLVLTVWCYYFFRDPRRTTPEREGLVVSPADGVVSQIVTDAPPPELGMPEGAFTRVSVFMSVFDCHVNRAPVAGTVAGISYRPGRFLNASLDKASVHNERNGLRLRMEDGRQIAVVQIAGLVARRILCFAREGDRLRTGERFGLIRFGSRLDVYLPEGVAPLVAVGQTMVAGETVLADLRSQEGPRNGRTE